MPLLVLAHVDADDGILVAEDDLRQGLGELRLPHAGRAEEEEGGDGVPAVLEPRPRQSHRLAHRPDRLVLADDALVQPLLHPHEPLPLLGGQLGDGDAGLLGDDLRHVLDAHLAARGLARSVPVLQLPIVVLLALVDALLEALRLVEVLPGARVVALAPQLLQLTRLFLQGGRARRTAEPDSRGCLIDEVDGLVGQVAAGDVAVGQLGGGGDGLVGDGDLVMGLESVPEPAQDGDGLLDRRLGDQHRLESPLQRRIFFNVFLVFVQRRGAYTTKVSPGERRLQHV